MFSRLREHFGTAGLVVAIVALVAALGGGAYAASGGNPLASSSKAKQGKQGKQGKPGKNGADGAPGPAGPQGPAGPAGPQGAKGDKGDPGEKGQDGTSVTSAAINPGGACGSVAGVKYHSVSGDSNVCNGSNGADGVNGSPWTPNSQLPASATETGYWTLTTTQAAVPSPLGAGAGPIYFVPISFPIQLANGLDLDHTIYVPNGDTTTAHCSASSPNGPGGTLTNPKADSGYLCVYAAGLTNAAPATAGGLFSQPFFPAGGIPTLDGSGVAGTSLLLSIPASGDAFGAGSWAVTG